MKMVFLSSALMVSPWSEAIDVKYNPVLDDFKKATVVTRITLAAAHVGKPLKVGLDVADPKLINSVDNTKELGLLVSLNKNQIGAALVELTGTATAENNYDLDIEVVGLGARDMRVGDYAGSFAMVFEYGV
ncbi:hypothetical protein PBPRB1979 [Photobacterium profundum SS9]|uniref:Uncharacterized protein n=2 Tax=Photobacterium profundum TaxID=74109 RepID=Q6LFV6_PHOPR|nr:hypothetical protein PBPRB1979 [Photobacterium profundum SS9]